MADNPGIIFSPLNYSELFSEWNRYPEAVLYAGGTGILQYQDRRVFDLPPVILSLDNIVEMRRISRTRLFLEIGGMVKLSQIIDLGKTVPLVLQRCLENIAGPQLRNMATIGGNICFPERCLDCSAALSALDAQFELRTTQTSRWITAPRFFSGSDTIALNHQELLTRIRIPLDNWNYTAYKKFGSYTKPGRTIIFLVKSQKNILNDIKIICKTNALWRNKDSEGILIGKQLPLTRRIAADFVASWEDYLKGIYGMDELSRQELINFIEMNIFNLIE
ncbi:MAG: FAD binding domain-containing protein [Treponema sp.]|nr:FAD binding domain-containing protein [Treponema sp.]